MHGDTSLDLTPFGFTPTESVAYQALLTHGPMGGYALGKALTIARANAYQALAGLEAKGAVEATRETPRRYRPIHPESLLAAIVDRQATRLNQLEATLQEAPADEASRGFSPISSARALEDLMLRTAARTRQDVICLAPAQLLEQLTPAWHKRQADGSVTLLWATGTGEARLPIPLQGVVAPSRADPGTVLSVLGDAAVLASYRNGSARGFWSNDPLQRWLASTAVRHLTT